MKEVICISVILFGLAGQEQQVVPSYVPTIAAAAATIAETSPVPVELTSSSVARSSCASGRCGMRKSHTVIRRSAPTVSHRRRFFRGRRMMRSR
jgi:hypothetical protein